VQGDVSKLEELDHLFPPAIPSYPGRERLMKDRLCNYQLDENEEELDSIGLVFFNCSGNVCRWDR
jgi:hypothetical protein